MFYTTKEKSTYKSLGFQTAQQAKVSDHEPVVYGNKVAFNIMMKARYNEQKNRYNNGFAIKAETTEQYQARLQKVASVLGDILESNPQVTVIALEEAPIKPEDINAFITAIKTDPRLKPFHDDLTAKNFTQMGVATIFDTQQLSVTQIVQNEAELPTKSLIARTQEYRLYDKQKGSTSYVANMHLPYDIAKNPKNYGLLLSYLVQLMNHAQASSYTLMGDFNFLPLRLIHSEHGFSGVIPLSNNSLIKAVGSTLSVIDDTVDAILTVTQRPKTLRAHVNHFTLFKQLSTQADRTHAEEQQEQRLISYR